MNNVLFEPLPTEWNGYEVNTDFQVGVQLSLCFEDDDLSEEERTQYAIYLLFCDEKGNLRNFPEREELEECLKWYMTGWNHDNSPKSQERERLLDYYVDQGRIYADFRQIYHINLNNCELHWWEFQWLLWNMPHSLSSFMQVIDIRTKKPGRKASADERKAILEAQKIYGLSEKKKTYTEDQKIKIDEFDEKMKKIKQSKAQKQLGKR